MAVREVVKDLDRRQLDDSRHGPSTPASKAPTSRRGRGVHGEAEAGVCGKVGGGRGPDPAGHSSGRPTARPASVQPTTQGVARRPCSRMVGIVWPICLRSACTRLAAGRACGRRKRSEGDWHCRKQGGQLRSLEFSIKIALRRSTLGRLLDLRPAPNGQRIVSVRLEAPEEVDDVVVTYENGTRLHSGEEAPGVGTAPMDGVWRGVEHNTRVLEVQRERYMLAVGTLTAIRN